MNFPFRLFRHDPHPLPHVIVKHVAATASPASHWLPQPLPHHSYAHVNEVCYQAVRRALFPDRRRREIRRDARAYKAALAATTAQIALGLGEP